MKKNNIRLVYFSTPTKLDISSTFLNPFSGQLVDIKTVYSKRVKASEKKALNLGIHYYQYDVPSTQLISLSIQSGAFSRFKVDENISNKKFEELYTLFITNSVNKKIADDVLIYTENSDTLGVITLKCKKNMGEIGILAVDEKARGKGIGKLLINSAENYFRSRSCAEIQVVTQKRNIVACKFYEACEYQLKSINYFYHFWL